MQIDKEYKVKVGDFEGPLDLLLDLIERRKLCVNDVSLAEITESFLGYLEQLSDLPISTTANFIAVAATMLLIKSASLLPTFNLTPEEAESVADLEERLRKLKEAKEKAVLIKKLFGESMIFFPEFRRSSVSVFSPTAEVTKENLAASIRSLVVAIPQKEVLQRVAVKKIISLEEAIDSLVLRIQRDLKTSFSKISNRSSLDPAERKAEKAGVIVNFLAVLELVKRGLVFVNQEKHFMDIDIESGEHDTPRYGEDGENIESPRDSSVIARSPDDKAI